MRDPFDDEIGMVRNDHPDTAVEAAVLVLPRSGTQRRRVYDLIERRAFQGGLTDLQIQKLLAMPGNTERPRRRELVRDGLVVDSGKRRVQSGRQMIVWTVVK